MPFRIVNSPAAQATWRIHVDTGGTFTDCIVEAPDDSVVRVKVLSRGTLPAVLIETSGPCELRIEAPWNAPDDFPVGFGVRFPGRPGIIAEVSAYEAATRKLTLVDELPFTPEPGEPLELDSGLEAPAPEHEGLEAILKSK